MEEISTTNKGDDNDNEEGKETNKDDDSNEETTDNDIGPVQDFIEFVTEGENYYVTIKLDSDQQKIIFNACKDEIGDIFYSNEFDLNELYGYKVFDKYTIEKIMKILVESINSGRVKLNLQNDELLTLNISIIKKKKSKYERQRLDFGLKKNNPPKDENEKKKILLNLLINKVNFLIRDKDNYLRGCKLNLKMNENKKDYFSSRIKSLKNNLEALEKRTQSFIESNLLSCSNIVNTLEDWKITVERLRTINDKYNNILFKLVYRATRDGDSSEDFHKKCDNIKENITLVKTTNNQRFGGFTKNNWKHLEQNIVPNKPEVGSSKYDVDAFCFSINLNKIYDNFQLNEGAIFCCNNYGPTFCKNIFAINNKMLEKGGYCMAKKNSCFKGQDIDYEISGGKRIFGVKELEVFEIIFI